MSTLLASNSRNRLWHSAESLVHDFSACTTLLDKYFLPAVSEPATSAAVPAEPLFADLLETVHIYNLRASASCPHLCYDVAQQARDALFAYGIVGGVFDKFLTKHYGVCKLLLEQRIVQDTLMGSRFSIFAYCASVKQASLSALYVTLQRAQLCGVTADAIKRRACRRLAAEPLLFAH